MLNETRMVDPALFRAGDPATFEAVVNEHRSLVRSLVRRYVTIEEDAQDLVQHVFARAFEHCAQFRGESSIRTWLCRIAVNEALRHKRRQPPFDHQVDVEDIRAFTHGLQTSKLVAVDLWRKVEKHLEALPPKQRLVVELRTFHDLPFAEIGEIAECSEAAARVNFATGVKALRAILQIPT